MLYRVHLTISGISGDRPLTHFITQHCIEYISPLAGLVVIDMHKLSTEISIANSVCLNIQWYIYACIYFSFHTEFSAKNKSYF
jgi:hypothetical protein